MSNQMMDDKFAISLTKCYYCGESNEIILNRRLTKPMADNVKEMDGKVVTMHPCTKCEEHMKQGVILITIDPEKSDQNWHTPPPDLKEGHNWMPNPYRTGGFFVLRDTAIARAINDEDLVNWALEKRWMFIEHEVANMLGLFEVAASEEENEQE